MILFGKKEDSEDLIYQAMSLLQKNQPKAAVGLFNKALKNDSKNISALHNKGLALNQMKKYSDAITCFEMILQIDSKDASAFNNKAIALAELGDTESALKYYDKAIEADAKYAPAYFNKGVLLDRLDEQDDASYCAFDKMVSGFKCVPDANGYFQFLCTKLLRIP